MKKLFQLWLTPTSVLPLPGLYIFREAFSPQNVPSCLPPSEAAARYVSGSLLQSSSPETLMIQLMRENFLPYLIQRIRSFPSDNIPSETEASPVAQYASQLYALETISALRHNLSKEDTFRSVLQWFQYRQAFRSSVHLIRDSRCLHQASPEISYFDFIKDMGSLCAKTTDLDSTCVNVLGLTGKGLANTSHRDTAVGWDQMGQFLSRKLSPEISMITQTAKDLQAQQNKMTQKSFVWCFLRLWCCVAVAWRGSSSIDDLQSVFASHQWVLTTHYITRTCEEVRGRLSSEKALSETRTGSPLTQDVMHKLLCRTPLDVPPPATIPIPAKRLLPTEEGV